MQPGKKISYEMYTRKEKKPLKTHHLSSFGILNRNGLEIAIVTIPNFEEEDDEILQSEFSDWLMPEPLSGYIRCRKHDFF
jgi:hypothetical protein